MIEPPQCSLWDEKELSSASVKVFQMSDHGRPVSGIVTGVSPILILRKVRTPAGINLKQVVIAFADDEGVAALRHTRAYQFSDFMDQLLILKILSSSH